MRTDAEQRLADVIEESHENIPRDLSAWANLAAKLACCAAVVLQEREDL